MRKDYFIAVDLGTTTVAATLFSSDESSPEFTESALNLQYLDCGTDSVKRIQNGLDSISSKNLQDKAILTINGLIKILLERAEVNERDIKALCIAGNTVMEMALCGYPLISLSRPPYRPLSPVFFPDNTEGLPGLCLKDRELFIFPVIDGFVGGDVVSSVYFLDMVNRKTQAFMADFGTNVELVVGGENKIYTTSAPAGPAFEAGNISSGMTASNGAISGVSLKDGIFEFKVIGDVEPSGICGSGIMSLVDSLLKEKIIDKNGRILPPGEIETESYRIVHKIDGKNEIILYLDEKKAIKFSQEDVRQFQFAKSAVKSAAGILIEKYKLPPEIDFEVFLTGSFGNHIDPDVIDRIDIFPFKNKKINFLNDSVLLGGKKYLLSSRFERDKGISGIIRLSKNFPLSGSGIFEKMFISNTAFTV